MSSTHQSIRAGQAAWIPVLWVTCLLGVTLQPHGLMAQGRYSVTWHTIETGLPTANVRLVTEDGDGFIWCASEEGLIRFDGSRFKVYRSQQDSRYGLLDNKVTRQFRDRDGRLWIFTHRGIHRYDRRRQSFVQYPYSERPAAPPTGRWELDVLQSSDGAVWVRTDMGMNRYDPKADRFTFFPWKPMQPNSDDENAHWVESRGALWFVEEGMLWRFDMSSGLLDTVGFDGGNSTSSSPGDIFSVYTAPDGTLIVVGASGLTAVDPVSFHARRIFRPDGPITSDMSDGMELWLSTPDLRLYRYDMARELLRTFPAEEDGDNIRRAKRQELRLRDPRDRSIRLVAADRRGGIWGSFPDNSLFRYDPNTRTTQIMLENVLRGREGFDISEDRSGTTWVAATGAGLVQFEYHPRRFVTHAMPVLRSAATSIETNNVRCFLQWSPDSVYVGTLNGVYLYRPSQSRCEELLGLSAAAAGILKNPVWSMAKDRHGRLWIGTEWERCAVYKPESGEVRILFSQKSRPPFIRTARVRAMRLTEDGSMILGVSGGSVAVRTDSVQMDGTREIFAHLLAHYPAEDESQAANRLVYALHEDRSGRLWIGTDRGLQLYLPATGEWLYWTRTRESRSGLVSDDIRTIHEDARGRIWLGTHGGGLHQFDPREGTIRVFDVSHGLPDDIIYSIEHDRHGSLWLGTHHGLCRLNPATGEVRIYDPTDGLQDYEFNTGASLVLPDGRMLFGGVKGFSVFYPDSIRDNLAAPNVVITRLLVAEVERSFDPGGMELAHDENSLTFEFAALSHYRVNNQLYAYKLEGVDEDWVHPGSRRFATYTKLPPGEYVFRVIARNSEGRWNVTGASLPVVISPAWWQSPLAYAFYIVTILGLAFTGIRVQQRRVLHRERIRNDMLAAELRAQTAEAEAKALAAENEVKEVELRRAEQLRVAYAELERTNAQMRASRTEIEKLSRAVHQSPAIVIITNTNGAIEYVNPKFSEVTGYTADEVLGRNPRLLKSPHSSPSLYRQLWKTLAGGQEWRGELQNARKDGSAYWVLTSISPLTGQDGNVTHYIGIQEDITERKRTEDMLARRTEELETVDRIVEILNREFDLHRLHRAVLEQGLELLPMADRARMYTRDAASDRYVLRDAVNYTRADADERIDAVLEGCRVLFDFPESGMQLLAAENTAARDGNGAGENTAAHDDNGAGDNTAAHDDNGAGDNTAAVLGAAADTRHPQTPSMLLMAVQYSSEQSSGSSMLLFDSCDARCVFDPEDARRLLRYREHAITALTRSSTLQDLRRKNEELVRTQEQLVVQQKLASLGQLTAGIAHEIRNPLNFVNNFALTAKELVDEIQESLDLGEDPAALFSELRLTAEKIREHGTRANRIVEGMLLHARSKRGERQATEINRLLKDALHLAYHGRRASDADFHVTIEKQLDPDLRRTELVPPEISRVFLGLLDNAFYAVAKKQQAIGIGTYEPTVTVATRNLRNEIEIRIRDNGDGIPAEIRERIFEPFFTTKPTGEGTGLGLSLCYDVVVEEHRGTLAVDSGEGEWTEFIITLPSPQV